MAGPIRIAILANGRQARAEATKTAKSYGVMGKQISKLAKVAAGAFAIREIYRAGAAITQVGGQYVGSLNKIQALTGASNKELTRAAKLLEDGSGAYAKMGQTTGDAAAGVVELTKAGLSLKSSLAAVRSTMVLAKAGELDVADASTLVANTLNTFHLKASQAADIANGLANAANISSADVSDLAESFKYVAPIAAKAGVSLDQTNAILAELSNSGVKASQAGTGLRKFLLSLQAPAKQAREALKDMNVSVYDAQGKMRPLPDLINQMRDGLSKLTQQDQNKDLKAVFGLTGLTSAQIILENGAKGLATYTKGVQRAGAAQKLANAQSKGLLGTLQSLKARGISSIQSLYRVYSPVLNQKIQDLTHWVEENKNELIDAGTSIKNTVLPPLKLLVGLAKTGVHAFTALPAPIRNIGIEAGIAALIFPRLTAGVTAATGSVSLNIAKLQQWRAELTYSATRAQALTGITTKLGAAARTTAGIGGMVALAEGAKSSNKAINVLGETAGGALTGFAVGGPWGAAVGGGIGLLHGLYSATHKSSTEMADAKQKAAAYADSIDRIASASGKAARAETLRLLQSKGIVSQARVLGISTSDLISATLGQGKAIDRINRAYKSQTSIVKGLDFQRLTDFINAQGFAIDQHRKKIKEDADAINGVRRTSEDAAKTTRLINRALRDVGHARPGTGAFARFFNMGIRGVVQDAKKGSDRVNASLKQAGKTKANTDPWLFSLNAAIAKGRRAASSGGRSVGSALGEGVHQGIVGKVGMIISAAQNAVAQAIAAAHKQADAHSPSRKMKKLGEYLGDGLIIGMQGREYQAARAGERLANSALKGSARYGTHMSGIRGVGSGGGIRRAVVQIGQRDFEGYIDELAEAAVHRHANREEEQARG